ncbi:MAG: alginate lyase family protein, partial [Candidatus Cryptobacteroides sp.]
MKLIQNILTAVTICTILQSCEIVQICPSQEHLEQKTFVSILAPDTKTTLVDGKKVYWTEGDAISIFDNSSWSNNRFVAADLNGNAATFTGYTKPNATAYYALYPYSSEASCDSYGTISTTLPNSQKAIPGTFDTGLNISVAVTKDENLSFKNVCALVKMTVPEDMDDIVSLTLSSIEPLAGDMKIAIDKEGCPSMSPVSASSSMDVTIGDGEDKIIPGNYYFVIAPGNHQFTIYVRLSSGQMYARSSASVLTIDANQIINCGNVPASGVSMKAHPCALVNAGDIARVRAAVSAADPSDPVYAAYKSFCGNKYAQASYTPNPVATIVRGDVTGTGVESQNYMNIARDAAAAFQLALRWQITGETSYADAAVNILNQWTDVCTQITANDNNQYLCAGFQGHALGNAAELLRDYEGWAAADQDDFKTWLRTVWIAKNEWFIDTHGGERN